MKAKFIISVLFILLVFLSCNNKKDDVKNLLEGLDVEDSNIKGEDMEREWYKRVEINIPNTRVVTFLENEGKIHMVELERDGNEKRSRYNLWSYEEERGWIEEGNHWELEDEHTYFIHFSYGSDGILYGASVKDTAEGNGYCTNTIYRMLENGVYEEVEIPTINEIYQTDMDRELESRGDGSIYSKNIIWFKITDDGMAMVVYLNSLIKYYDLVTGKELSHYEMGGHWWSTFVTEDELVIDGNSIQTSFRNLRVLDRMSGEYKRTIKYGNDMGLTSYRVVTCREEGNVYVCTRDGLFGGEITTYELDTIIEGNNIGISEDCQPLFLDKDENGNFYLIYEDPLNNDYKMLRFEIEPKGSKSIGLE